ncbi:MAG: type II toxin-antitoxin system VapB family antitoxin [Betaproteobacteria bacterium]|nr:type II toxin-antitoxin system VapB family antitoxin [Betaproteobacteria bacterium]
MRTTILIDDNLMNDALDATGLKTKREVVELGLRTVLQLHKQEEIHGFRGKINLQGDLEVLQWSYR